MRQIAKFLVRFSVRHLYIVLAAVILLLAVGSYKLSVPTPSAAPEIFFAALQNRDAAGMRSALAPELQASVSPEELQFWLGQQSGQLESYTRVGEYTVSGQRFVFYVARVSGRHIAYSFLLDESGRITEIQ